MKTKIYLFAVVLATVLFSGCAKDGATGPAGPAGANGNANVQTFIFGNQAWVTNNTINLSVPVITQTIIDKGTVVVYGADPTYSPRFWNGLPNSNVNVIVTLGNVEIYSPTVLQYNPIDVKVTVIAGS